MGTNSMTRGKDTYITSANAFETKGQSVEDRDNEAKVATVCTRGFLATYFNC